MLVPFALLLVAAAAAIADWRTGEIPNWLTLPAMGAAVILHGVLGGKAGLADSVLGLIGCGLVPYLMFRWNAIGGGDVKLFAALGAIGGLALGIEAQMFGMMFALVAGVVLTLRQGSLRQTLANTYRLLGRAAGVRRSLRPMPMTSIRLGASILAGSIVAVVARL